MPPASYRAISLVSCRAVAILIMSLRRGIPPSLISRGQYLSAVGDTGADSRGSGLVFPRPGPRNPPLLPGLPSQRGVTKARAWVMALLQTGVSRLAQPGVHLGETSGKGRPYFGKQ